MKTVCEGPTPRKTVLTVVLCLSLVSLAPCVTAGFVDDYCRDLPHGYKQVSDHCYIHQESCWDGYGGQFKLCCNTSRHISDKDDLYLNFWKKPDVSIVADGVWTNFGPYFNVYSCNDSHVCGYPKATCTPDFDVCFYFNAYCPRYFDASDFWCPQIHAKKSSHVCAYDSCGSGKKISMIFHDGPEVGHDETCQVLDVLKEQNCKATFFVCPHCHDSDSDKMDKKCSLVKRMIDDGHYVGCQCWDQEDFTNPKLSFDSIKHDQLDRCVEWIRECSCEKNFTTKHFCPGGKGNLDQDQADYISNQLDNKICFWSVDSNDDDCPGDYDKIWKNVDDKMTDLYAKHGHYESQIIRFHDKNQYNACDSKGEHVIKKIIDNYGRSGCGYDFVTVDECYHECDQWDDGMCKNRQCTHKTLCSWDQTCVGCQN